MKIKTCPLDGAPCEADCPDRYQDVPEGGCYLTTAVELGAKIIPFDNNGTVGILFEPSRKGD